MKNSLREELVNLSKSNEFINEVVGKVIDELKDIAKTGAYEATIDLVKYNLTVEQAKSVQLSLSVSGIRVLNFNLDENAYTLRCYWY